MCSSLSRSCKTKKIKNSLKVGQSFIQIFLKNLIEHFRIETPNILRVVPKINLSDSLIYNGSHASCLIDLLSLETNMSDSDSYKIRHSFDRSKKGSLRDEFIKCYMYMLTQENDSYLYYDLTEAMILQIIRTFPDYGSTKT